VGGGGEGVRGLRTYSQKKSITKIKVNPMIVFRSTIFLLGCYSRVWEPGHIRRDGKDGILAILLPPAGNRELDQIAESLPVHIVSTWDRIDKPAEKAEK
jgi:hypothetical protein